MCFIGRQYRGIATVDITAVTISTATIARRYPLVFAGGAFVGLLFEFLNGLHAGAVVDGRALAATTVATRVAATGAGVARALPVAISFPFLPGEDDTGNTDLLAFDFKALFLLFAALGFQRATVVATRADGAKTAIAFLSPLGQAANGQQDRARGEDEYGAVHSLFLRKGSGLLRSVQVPSLRIR